MRDVADQLRAWSRSLAESIDPIDISAATSPVDTPRKPVPNRRWLAVAASLVVIVAGVGAVVLAQRSDSDRIRPVTSVPVTTQPTASPASNPRATPTTQPTSSSTPSSVPDTSTPTSPSTETSVVKTAVPFQATGSATDICSAALIAVSDTGYTFDGVVLDDISSTVDGDEWRWLLCGGDAASGWGVAVLVSTDSTNWKTTDLGLGSFVHAGDEATLTVDGPQATVRYQSLVGERNSEAVTTDIGTTWSVSDARAAPVESDGCDRAPSDHYDDGGSIQTIPDAANANDITVDIHIPLRRICPGGEIPMTLTVTNTTSHDTTFAPGVLILSQGAAKWSIGDIPETPIPAGATTFLTVQATTPDLLRPGTYDVGAYGYRDRTALTLSPPT